MNRMHWMGLLVFTLALGFGSAHAGRRERAFELTMQQYESAVRWEGMARGADFLDPSARDKLAPQGIELERYKHVRVGRYVLQSQVPQDKDHVRQIVEIELINVHNQDVRQITDVQEWRWDKKKKAWYRISALPKL